MVALTDQPIDSAAVLAQVASHDAGAVVLFLGTTREFTRGRHTASLDYECYPEMAEKKLAELEAEARRRWPLTGCSIVHRLGHLELGEASIAIAVSSPTAATPSPPASGSLTRSRRSCQSGSSENWADGTSRVGASGHDK